MRNDAAYQNGLAMLGLSEGEEKTITPDNSNVQFHDGDSGMYAADGREIGYRMLGLDAPETAHARQGAAPEPLAYVARDEKARLIEESGGARFESTGEKDNGFDRDLGILRGEDGRDLNAELIRSGSVNEPMFEPSGEHRLAFVGANLRNNTEVGDLLQGTDREVNERVRGAQQQAFLARERGELGTLFPPKDPHANVSTARAAYTRGVHNMNAGFAGFAASVADVTGAESLKGWSEEKMEAALRKADEFPAELQHWDDIESLDNFGTFALERIMENVPQLSATALAMLGTGGASLALRTGFAKSLSRELGVDARASMGRKVRRDASVGLNVGLYTQLTGETATQLHSAGVEEYGSTALIAGAVKTPMERMGLNSLFTKGVANKIATEGVTEGLQTITDNIAEGTFTGEGIFSDDNVRDTLTATLAGGIVGGAFAIAHDGVPAAYKAAAKAFSSDGVQQLPSLSGDTPTPTAGSDGSIVTNREPLQDIEAQVKAFSEGNKSGVFASASNPEAYDSIRNANKNATVIETPSGILATTKPIDVEAYSNASPAEQDAMRTGALSYTQNKSEIDPNTSSVVQTVSNDTGAIVHEEVVNNSHAASAFEEHIKNAPENTTVRIVHTDAAITARAERVNEEDARQKAYDAVAKTSGKVLHLHANGASRAEIEKAQEEDRIARAELAQFRSPQKNSGVSDAQPTKSNDPAGTDVLSSEQPLQVDAVESAAADTGAVDSGVPGAAPVVGELGQATEPTTGDSGTVHPRSGRERLSLPTSRVPSSGPGRVVAPAPVQTSSGEGGRDLSANPTDGNSAAVLGDDPAPLDAAQLHGRTAPANARAVSRNFSPEAVAAVIADPQQKAAASAYMAQGMSATDAIYRVLQERFDGGTDQTAYLDALPGDALTPDAAEFEQQEGTVISDQYGEEDLDSSDNLANTTDGQAFNGQLLGMHILAMERSSPTWLVKQTKAGKDSRGNTRFTLSRERKSFATESAAQKEADKLKLRYSMEIFVPVQNPDGSFFLSRHRLSSGATDNVDPIKSWFYQIEVFLNLRTKRHLAELNALSKRIDEASDESTSTQLRRAYNSKYAELVPVWLNGLEHLLHAPTITQFGARLISDADKTTSLEYYQLAFFAGLSGLHQNGYTTSFEDIRAVGNIAFTPTANKLTGDKAALERAERQAEGYDIPVSISKKISALQGERYAVPHNMPREQKDSIYAGIDAQIAELRALRKESIANYGVRSLRNAQDGRMADSTSEAVAKTGSTQSVENRGEHGEIRVTVSEIGYWGDEFLQPADYAGDMQFAGFDEPGAASLRQVTKDNAVNTKPFKRSATNTAVSGVTPKEVLAAADKFLKEFPGANDVVINVDPHQTIYTNRIDKGSFDPATNTLTLFAGNMHDATDVQETIKHEILAHKGLGFLSPSESSKLFSDIAQAIKYDPRVAEAFSSLTTNYAEFSELNESGKLEETLAFIAEGLNTGLVSRTWNRIIMAVRDVLRALGLVPNHANLEDVQAHLHKVASAFRRGTRAGQRAAIDGTFNRTLNTAQIQRTVKDTASGFKKLALPMFSGLYQLKEISTQGAALFKNFWAAQNHARSLYGGEFQNRVNLSSQEVSAAWTELNALGEDGALTNISPTARKLRNFLDQFYDQYVKPNMPTIGKIKNYLPQLIDLRVLQDRRADFIRVATQNGLNEREAEGTWKALLETGGTFSETLEDMQGVVGPSNSHMKKRSIRNPQLMAALEQEGFMYADKREAIDHYISVSVKRGAFEKTMGGFRDVHGFATTKGARNYEVLSQLLTNAGRSDLVEQHVGNGPALLQAAIDQGYAKVTAGKQLGANVSLSGMSEKDAYMVLSRLALRDKIAPRNYNPHIPVTRYASYLRSEGVKIPLVFNNVKLSEQLHWYAPSQQLTWAREAIENPAERTRFDDITHGFMGYFGARVSPTVHKWQSNIMAYESLLTLAFNTLSSFPDVAGPFLRIMREDGIQEALANVRQSMRTIGDYSQIKAVARDMGFINKRQAQSALKEMWGTDHYSPHAQLVMDKLFKFNGQEAFTNMTRVFAFSVGRTYFKSKSQSMEPDALKSYGITPEIVERWAQAGEPVLTMELLEQGGQRAQDAQAMHDAFHQFVDESIVRPNAGQRPVWANDPRFALFWHLKSFLWAYWSTVLSPNFRGIGEQLGKGNYGEAAGRTALTGILLMPLAAIGWEVRQLLQYTLFGQETSSKNMDGFEYSMQLINRTGLAGPMQLALDFTGQDSATDGAVRISGPALDHVWTLLNGDLDKKIYRSVPLLGQLYGAQKNISEGF